MASTTYISKSETKPTVAYIETIEKVESNESLEPLVSRRPGLVTFLSQDLKASTNAPVEHLLCVLSPMTG